MPLNRFLKYLNIVIALVLVAGAGAGWWFLFRPLPQTQGRVAAPVGAEVAVVRDELGVPHITASSGEDLWFAQGYVTAQDRLFQMDVMRRRAAGEIAEILGPGAVESDRTARLLRLDRLAVSHARTIETDERRALAAYSRGVNHFIETHSKRLPPAFTMLGYTPRPWRISDSVLVGLEMYRSLSSVWKQELLKQSFLERGDPAKVEALFPVRSGFEFQPGSNAWALSGERTQDGYPLLANDPHLDYSIPPIWYQVHLQTDDLDVAGMVLPGLPGVIIGHNRHIAWGITNLRFDVQDLYRERLDSRTGRYVHQGRIRQADRETTTILVRGGSPIELAWWRTLHGPVVVSAGQLHLALRWTAAEPGAFKYPFLKVSAAKDWTEFREAMSGFSGPAQNFVYADAEGNIGYQAAGDMPIRTYDSSVPVDGESGAFEWQGMIPFDDLPSHFNPPDGVVITANQNPFPTDYPYQVTGVFAAGYRANRIRELLADRQDWTVDGLAGVQTDVYDGFFHELAGEVVKAYEASPTRVGNLDDAVSLLRDWDGKMATDAAAPLLIRLLYQHLRRAVAEAAAPDAGLAYASGMAPAVIHDLLRNRPDGWFDDFDRLLLRVLVDAAEEGRRMQGDNIRAWNYGRYNEYRPSGGVLERLPVIGRYLGLDPMPLAGSPHTVQQTTPSLGPSARLLLATGEWDRSQTVLPFGQSGHRLSKHYHDQTEAYLGGTAFEMQFEHVAGEARLLIVPGR